MKEKCEKARRKIEKQNKRRGLILLSFFLFACVMVTSVLLTGRLGGVTADDRNVIDLVPEEAKAGNQSVSEGHTESAQDETRRDSGVGAVRTDTSSGNVPGFQVGDDTSVWSTDTEIEIFRISYQNGQEVVTVNGANDDKLIAPGTENAYTFWLKNTGTTAVDYTVEIEAYMTPEDVKIPVEARLKDYEGTYLAGSDSQWEEVLGLNGVQDRATLGVNRYAQYILEWQWPFETADGSGEITEGDAYDTALGDRAAEEDLALTIVIRTVASAEADAEGGGLNSTDSPGTAGSLASSPKTGDTAGMTLYVLLLAGAVIAVILILLFKRRKKEEEEDLSEEVSDAEEPDRKI